jgi:hypothetical protein
MTVNNIEGEPMSTHAGGSSSDDIDGDSSTPIATLDDESRPERKRRRTSAGKGQPSRVASRGWIWSITDRWAECVLAVIILSSMLLTLFWVFEVPIMQNPDETSHIDYAFSIYSAGRLLNVRRPPSQWNLHAQKEQIENGSKFSHQYTLYLIDSTEFQRVRFHPEEKMSPDYGTAAYYLNLELNAPHIPAKVPDLQPQDNPWLVKNYPFGYYFAVAVWLRLVRLFKSGPVALFLGARIFSVILLCGSLILSYATLRELRLRKLRALALTSIIAFFPLTTFVSSSVQPDTLSWTLMSLCFYLALLLRRRQTSYWLVAMLGTALGLLLVTKYHFYVFTAAAILSMVVSEHFFKRRSSKNLLRVATILLLPSLMLFAVQLWVAWGNRGLFSSNLSGSLLFPAMAGPVEGVKNAIVDFYGGGTAFVSWWGLFGWMDAPLIIKSPVVQNYVLLTLTALTVVVLGLFLFRLEQVLTRLVALARSGRWRTALRIVFSNPLVNSHLIFTVFMIALFALTTNGAQGRYWLPYILSSLLITTEYAPRSLSHRKTQAVVSMLMILGLLVFCGIGSYYSIQTIKERYYVIRTTKESVG